MSAVLQDEMWRGRSGKRALNYAVLTSLVFHALLFTLLSGVLHETLKSRPLPPTIVARLAPQTVQAPPARAEPTPVKPQPPQPRVEPPPLAKPLAKPSPIPRDETPPPPKAAPVVPAPSVEPAPPAPSPPSQQSAPSAPLARTEPQPAAPSVQDSGTLDQYRIDLISMARKYKRYPRVAMDNNWEGRVVIRMVVGANGMIASLSVISSTGHEVLDKQALDMIQKAKGSVLIPPALRGREFAIEIPVIYDLKEQNSG